MKATCLHQEISETNSSNVLYSMLCSAEGVNLDLSEEAQGDKGVTPLVAKERAPEGRISYGWSYYRNSFGSKSKMKVDLLCIREQFSRSCLKEGSRTAVKTSFSAFCPTRQYSRTAKGTKMGEK